jgi:hypothetical protein
VALSLVTPVSGNVGRPFPTITGAGFTTTGTVRLRVFGPRTNLTVNSILTASGGNITTASKVEIIPWTPGTYTVVAEDITAVTSIRQTIKVSGSGNA